MRRRFASICLVLLAPLPLAPLSCDAASEAPRVQLEVTADGSGLTDLTNDLGFEITLDEARVAISGLVFTAAGEVHSAAPTVAPEQPGTLALRWLGQLLVPRAHAHPGHHQGGEVIGELPGRHVVDFLAPSPLGQATLIAASYDAANFTFVRASTEDGLDAGDALVGHTARLSGTARAGEVEIAFTIVVDSPEGRALVGAPFELAVGADTEATLGLRLLGADPFEGDTLFDGLDFAALDSDGDGVVRIGPDASDPGVEAAYNLFRRTFQTHDHFDIQAQEDP